MNIFYHQAALSSYKKYCSITNLIQKGEKMRITKIEGIGPVYGAKLNRAGINTTEKLLIAAANRKDRQKLAEQTGIPEKNILEWINRADLMRINGVGEEYSDLLEAAGVDTVKELRTRNAENLYQTLITTNSSKKLVRRIPSLSKVRHWIEIAASLEPVVTH